MRKLGFNPSPKKGFEDPRDKIDRVINKPTKEDIENIIGKSEQLKKIYDNLKFQAEVRENPIKEKHEYRVFGVETVNLNHYLNMRIWPRSIYVTDKLLRLVAAAKLEFLKRYIAKKRNISMNMVWILIIMFGVVVVLLVILFLLPQLGVL